MHRFKQYNNCRINKHGKWNFVFTSLVVILMWTVFSVQAASEADLANLSIEELMSRKVITASKTEQTFSDTAAAVFVIH